MSDIESMKKDSATFASDILQAKYEAFDKIQGDFDNLRTLLYIVKNNFYDEIRSIYSGNSNSSVQKVNELVDLYLRYRCDKNDEDYLEDLRCALRGTVCKDAEWCGTDAVTNRSEPIYFTVHFRLPEGLYGLRIPIVRNFSSFQDFESAYYGRLGVTYIPGFNMEKTIYSSYELTDVTQYIRVLVRG